MSIPSKGIPEFLKSRSFLYLDGSSTFVDVKNAPSLNPTSAMTLEAWVCRLDSGGHSNHPFVSKVETDEIPYMPGDWEFFAGWNAYDEQGTPWGDYVLLWSYADSTMHTASLPSGVELKTWYHAAGVYQWDETGKTGSVTLYINGTLISTIKISRGIGTNGRDVWIGRSHRLNSYFQGALAEVRFWSTARTQQQIEDSMNQALPSSGNTGLVGYWPLDEGSGSTAQDRSGSGNNGAITAPRWISATTWVRSALQPKVGSVPSLASRKNIPYIAYGASIPEVSTAVAKVDRLINQTWEPVGGHVVTTAGTTRTALHVGSAAAYLVCDPGGLEGHTFQRPLDATTPEWTPIGPTGLKIWESMRVQSASDAVYLGYVDAGDIPRVYRYQQSKWTELEGVLSGGEGKVNSLDLVVDEGTPYVAVSGPGPSSGHDRIEVRSYTNGAWVGMGNISRTMRGLNRPSLSLAVTKGQPYIFFDDNTFEDPVSIDARVMRYEGTSWVDVGKPGFAGTRVDMLQLTLSGGQPYVAFASYDNSSQPSTTVRVFTYDGSAWQQVGNDIKMGDGELVGGLSSLEVVDTGLYLVVLHHNQQSNSSSSWLYTLSRWSS